MAAGSKRKASGDSTTSDSANKRAKTTDEHHEQDVVQADAAIADATAENTPDTQQGESASSTDKIPGAQPDIGTGTALVDAPQQDEGAPHDQVGSPGSDNSSAGSPSSDPAKQYAAKSFNVGDIVWTPLIHPYLVHDAVLRGVAQQWSNNFTSTNIGQFKQSLTPAIIVALYTTNMIVLPILDGRLNSERKINKQANLNMSLDVVRRDSARNMVSNSDFSKTKLVLEHETTATDTDDSEDDEAENQAWQPPAGAHVHFTKAVPVEYSWPNQAVNRLQDASRKIMVDRYDFVHSTLLKLEPSKAETKLLAYIKKETVTYGEGLGGDAKPVDPPPEGVEENVDAPSVDKPDYMVPNKDNDENAGGDDEDNDTDDDQDQNGAPIRKATGGKRLPAVKSSVRNTTGGKSVKTLPTTSTQTTTKPSGSRKPKSANPQAGNPPKKGTKKPSGKNDSGNDGKKGVKKDSNAASKGQDESQKKSGKDDDNNEDGDDSESESDSDSDSEDYPYKSGRGKTSRKVKLNGATKFECSHPCKIKFRPKAKTPCGHDCCSRGITKNPVVQGKPLPVTDNTVAVINWPAGPDKKGNGCMKGTSGITKGVNPPAPKKGVATTIKKGRRDNDDDMNEFLADDGEPSPPTKKTTNRSNKNKDKTANDDDEDVEDGSEADSDDDDDDTDAGNQTKAAVNRKQEDPIKKAARLARERDMQLAGAEPEDDSDWRGNSTKKSGGASKGKTAATATDTKGSQKKSATKTKSRQGSVKAFATSGAGKTSARAPGPRKNQTSQTTTKSKARSGSGSAAASTAARKPSGSRPNTRSASASAPDKSTSLVPYTASEDDNTADPIDRLMLGMDRLDKDGNQIKATKTNTDAKKKSAETNTKTGSQSKEKPNPESNVESEDEDGEQEGMPGEVEELLAKTNKQTQTANNQIPTPEPVVEDDEDPWRARSEALAADGEDIQEVDDVARAVPAPNNGFALPLAEYVDEMPYGQEDNAYGGGWNDNDASEEELLQY